MRRLVGQDYARSPAEKLSDWVAEHIMKICLTVGLSLAIWFLIDGIISLANFVRAGGEGGHTDLFVPDPTSVIAVKAVGILLVTYFINKKRV